MALVEVCLYQGKKAFEVELGVRLVSKTAPNNSYLDFSVIDDELTVIKHYREKGRYSAGEELQCYKMMSALIDGFPNIRLAKAWMKKNLEDCLLVEYIPGKNLYEVFILGDISDCEKYCQLLLVLFVEASNSNIKFDSDPSNIMFDKEGLVLIDPICVDLDLPDYTFVVFYWGIIKSSLRNWRIWKIPRTYRMAYRLLEDYVVAAQIGRSDIKTQLIQYIDTVIAWNRDRNEVEGLITYSFRILFVIPLYHLVKAAVRRIL